MMQGLARVVLRASPRRAPRSLQANRVVAPMRQVSSVHRQGTRVAAFPRLVASNFPGSQLAIPEGARSLFIQTEQTPNPSTLKFLPGLEVLPPSHGTGMFLQKGDREYQRSPLAVRLFKVEGVASVFLGLDFVTVGKEKDSDWSALKPQIFSLLMDTFAEEDFKVVLDTSEAVVSDTTILEDDGEIVAMIKELLETRIRPAVQEDGGDIFYVSFDEGTGVVRVRLAGSCQGCPSSSVTLKSGVENMLMHYIPEVTCVEAVDEDVAKLEQEQREFERGFDTDGGPMAIPGVKR
mmetsp:Transcript_27984/g.62447  ORF Transcript_27984/g.62447 Transcript_27984/m.62447 type:complete len:292 (-) Transcript_27984:324-1199(-)